MRYYGRKSILLIAVLWLSCHYAASGLSTFRINENQINSDKNSDIFKVETPSCRQPSVSMKPTAERPLSELLQSLTKTNTPADFHKRLLQDEEQENDETSIAFHVPQSFLFSKDAVYLIPKFIAVCAMLLFAAYLLQGGSLFMIWNNLFDIEAMKIFFKLSFHAIRSYPTVEYLLSWTDYVMHSTVMTYTIKHVWPTIKTTGIQMMVTEILIQFWKATHEAGVGQPCQIKNYLPEWVIERHPVMVSMIEKGCKTMIRKIMNNYVQGSIVTLSSFMAFNVHDTLFPQHTKERNS